MEAKDPGSFARRLRRLREAAALTQEELAERAGLTSNAIGALERGERRRPYPHTVRVLADALALDDEGRADLAAAAKPGLPAASAPSASPGSPLVGRGRELQVVVAALSSGATRLLTVTGPGGVGKTRLALEVAHRVSATSGDPLVVVELAPVRDPALVLPTIAQALALPHAASGDPLAAITAYLGDRPRLLLLDNLEHLLPAAGDVGRLLDACPGLVVLVTSRAPLRIRGEQDVPLDPLALPDGCTVAAVERSAAARLLVDRARSVSPGFALTERTAPAIAQICRQLDGLPLALELAAAHARLLGPEALLARLDRAVSSPRDRDRPDRQSTVSSTLDWSHDLLTLDEQTGLRRLSVFAGGFTLDAAEVVLGDDVDAFAALAGLVDQSMVVVEPGGQRYRLLEPVRQYAAARVAGTGETEAVADRHAAWVCGLGAAARPALRSADQAPWLDMLQVEHGNLRAALSRLLDSGRPDRAAQLLSDTWLSWALRGLATEGLDWADRVRVHPAAVALPDAGRARLEVVVAGLRYATGDMAGCLTAAQAAVPLARDGRAEVLPEALVLLGSAQLFTGAGAEAEATLLDATTEASLAGDEWVATHVELAEGMRLLTVGDTQQAIRVLADGEASARALGSPFTLATGLNALATVSLAAGDDDAALARYLEAARLSVEMGTRWSLVYAVPGLATVAARRGQHRLAATLFAVGATAGEASSVAVAYPPDLAFAAAARVQVRAALDDPAYREATERGLETRGEDLLVLAAAVRRREPS